MEYIFSKKQTKEFNDYVNLLVKAIKDGRIKFSDNPKITLNINKPTDEEIFDFIKQIEKLSIEKNK